MAISPRLATRIFRNMHTSLSGLAERALSVLISLGEGNVVACARTLRQLAQGRGRQDNRDAGTRLRGFRAGSSDSRGRSRPAVRRLDRHGHPGRRAPQRRRRPRQPQGEGRPSGDHLERLGEGAPGHDRRHDRQPVGDQLRRPAPERPRRLEARGGPRERRGRLRPRAHRLRAVAQRPHAHRVGRAATASIVVTEPGLFSVAAADRALRAIEEIRRGLSPRLQPLGIVVNRVRPQSIEHQFRIKELRDMFGPLVLSPQLPERTSLQQAQGAAKPLHIWPGDSAQEMSRRLRRAARPRDAHRPHRRVRRARRSSVESPVI